MRPSLKTSIFAPTRCGVEPVVDTIVTSAAASPRSSAAATAAKTSWFIGENYRTGGSGASVPMHIARDERLGTGQERFADHARARRAGQLAGVRVDLDPVDALGRVERNARVPGERAFHEHRPDRQRRARAGEA